jgi:hypothetical protein
MSDLLIHAALGFLGGLLVSIPICWVDYHRRIQNLGTGHIRALRSERKVK